MKKRKGTKTGFVKKFFGGLLTIGILSASVYGIVSLTKKDNVDGPLDAGNTIVDPEGEKYETPKQDSGIINDGHVNDENGKNDSNRTEKDDPSGSMNIEEEEKNNPANQNKEEETSSEQSIFEFVV